MPVTCWLADLDKAAETYQRTRPVWPPQLFDDLVRLAGLARGDRVAEIGCGTGQATVPLAAVNWGLPDSAHFSRLFRRAYGLPPAEYRRSCHAS